MFFHRQAQQLTASSSEPHALFSTRAEDGLEGEYGAIAVAKHLEHGVIIVIPVAPLLWAVYDFGQAGADAAIGHIDCDGTRFRVGLAGDELEPYSFLTLRESSEWFAEYCSALSLGCRS